MTASENGVTISVVVDHAPDTAFRLFTEAIDDWWHPASLASTVTLDANGLVETSARGHATLASVIAWDPPTRIELDWSGPHSRSGDRVLVEFEAVGGGTRVTVRHIRSGLTPATADGGALGIWWANRLRAMSNINSDT